MAPGENSSVPSQQEVRQSFNALLGPPALLPEEDAARYREFADEIEAHMSPKDMVERIWVRDVVDLVWETMRLRDFKARLIAASSHKGLNRLLDQRGIETSKQKRLVEGWARRDPKLMREVKAILARAGLDETAISAETFFAQIETFDRLDTMVSRLEARRNAMLREMGRYREATARHMEKVIAMREARRAKQIAGAGGTA